MNYRIHRAGEVRVPLPPEEAMPLFTPEGERAWVPGWDPAYPAGAPSLQPGTVFVTGATTWVVTEAARDRASYARVTPGVQAGTVSVRCRPDGDGSVAHVTYHLTALQHDAEAELRDFADRYDDFMLEWERQIASAIADP